ncbi:hypothetical protein CC80DRAFT_506291 [Byssothecium circinans]|uniref:Uncharacterized protein n=1 Tax=Byssothecium circinans TaxID=147558 RepID=A0A6A5TSE6_9PLEO|nr:hypothetical protein CC80DRAFT_506291 [Byssothecium circinans]
MKFLLLFFTLVTAVLGAPTTTPWETVISSDTDAVVKADFNCPRGTRAKDCPAPLILFTDEFYGGGFFYWPGGAEEVIGKWHNPGEAACVHIPEGLSSLWVRKRKDRKEWECQFYRGLDCDDPSFAFRRPYPNFLGTNDKNRSFKCYLT